MHWQDIEVRKGGQPDWADMLMCAREKGTKKCHKCPYVPDCNRVEQGATKMFNEIIAPILLEECGINDSEDNLN